MYLESKIYTVYLIAIYVFGILHWYNLEGLRREGNKRKLITYLVPIRECLGKHSCMSSPFSIAILYGTWFFQQRNYKCRMRIRCDMATNTDGLVNLTAKLNFSITDLYRLKQVPQPSRFKKWNELPGLCQAPLIIYSTNSGSSS